MDQSKNQTWDNNDEVISLKDPNYFHILRDIQDCIEVGDTEVQKIMPETDIAARIETGIGFGVLTIWYRNIKFNDYTYYSEYVYRAQKYAPGIIKIIFHDKKTSYLVYESELLEVLAEYRNGASWCKNKANEKLIQRNDISNHNN